MVNKDREIRLINRDSGFIGYTVPDTGLYRKFTPGETKTVTFDEIEKLSWAPGGREMLKEYLIIDDKEAAEEILGEVEPEYFYTKNEVKKLLQDGSLEQLQDALEFAPEGVINLIKEEAVEMKIDSTAKREEIQKATNFNVTRSIELNEDDKENENQIAAATTKRRSTPIEATETKETTSGNSRYKKVVLK